MRIKVEELANELGVPFLEESGAEIARTASDSPHGCGLLVSNMRNILFIPRGVAWVIRTIHKWSKREEINKQPRVMVSMRIVDEYSNERAGLSLLIVPFRDKNELPQIDQECSKVIQRLYEMLLHGTSIGMEVDSD
jgi:hypothetical protein